LIKRRRQRVKFVLNIVKRQVCGQQTAATVDIVSHSARRNNSFIQVKGRHTADRKTIPPMHIRHGQRIFHNAGQTGDIGHLSGAFICCQKPENFIVGIHNSRHAHFARLRYQHAIFVNSFHFNFKHRKSPWPASRYHYV